MHNALFPVDFQTEQEVRKRIDDSITAKDELFFCSGISQLLKQWELVVDNDGEYFDE